MTATFRRRLDNQILRWQGLLYSDSADQVVPWTVAVVLFVMLVSLSLAQARGLESPSDLATYAQALWTLRHGLPPTSTVTTGDNVFAQQGAFILYPLAQLTRFVTPIPLLLTVQSAALALTVIPLWKVCTRLASLRSGAALIVLAVFALHPTTHLINVAGFHPEALALPALLGASYFALSQHWRRCAACCVFVLLCRADLGLAIAGLGVLVMSRGERRRGLVGVIVGLGWALGFLLFIQPHLGRSGVSQLPAYAAFGHTPLTILGGMLAHPATLFSHVLSHDNFQLLVSLFAPVLFLPFLSPRWLLPVVPLEVLYLAGDVSSANRSVPQAVAVLAFVFLAAPRGLSRLGRRNVDKVTLDRRLLGTLLLTAGSFFVLAAPTSVYAHPWSWGGRDATDGARLAAGRAISRDLRVRADDSLLTVLAERQVLFSLDNGGDADQRVDPAAAVDGVDVVVVDLAQFGPNDPGPTWVSSVEQQGFDLTSSESGIVILRRPGT